MRTITICLTVSAVWYAVAGTQPSGRQDAAQQVLADARQAMGGDAVLSAVRTFIASGRARRDLGPHVADQSLDIACALPDRFVRIVTYDTVFGGPPGFSMFLTQRDGFSGSQIIHETISTDRPIGLPPPVVAPPRTPEENEARERAALAAGKRPFARLTFALFAASFPSFPLELTSAGRVQLENGTDADAVDAKGPDGFAFRLLLDRASHLPVMIVWHDKPTVMVQQVTTTTSVVSSGGMPPLRTPPPPIVPPLPASRARGNARVPPGTVLLDSFPAGDPTAGLPLVEHQLSLADYRIVDGIKWPHRFVERVGGEVLEEVKISKFKVNAKVPDSKFKTAR